MGMLVFGMILALPGTVIGLPEFTARFNLTLADRGVFIATLFGGLLIGSLLSGPVVDRLGYRASVGGSAAAIAALLPAFALASSYTPVVAALAGVGLAAATLNTAANALSSELFPHERGRRMTFLSLAVSIGGLLLPTAIAAASGAVSWRIVVLAGAAVSAAAAAGSLVIASPPSHASTTSWASLRGFLGQRGFVRFCLLLACGAANEGAFAGWTSSYLVASGVRPEWATWGLSSHWLGLLVGRITLAGRVDTGKQAAIVWSAIAGALIMLLLIAAPVAPVLATGPFAAGVAIAVIVPTSLALAGERHRGNAGTLFGLLLTMAQVGAMVLAPLVGAVAERSSLRLALLLAVANAGGIVLLASSVERSRRPGRPFTQGAS